MLIDLSWAPNLDRFHHCLIYSAKNLKPNFFVRFFHLKIYFSNVPFVFIIFADWSNGGFVWKNFPNNSRQQHYGFSSPGRNDFFVHCWNSFFLKICIIDLFVLLSANVIVDKKMSAKFFLLLLGSVWFGHFVLGAFTIDFSPNWSLNVTSFLFGRGVWKWVKQPVCLSGKTHYSTSPYLRDLLRKVFLNDVGTGLKLYLAWFLSYTWF